MKAYILNGTGTIDALQRADIPVPSISAGEVLVRTAAIDINPVDSKTLRGAGQFNNIKNDQPVILGWGLSGTVEQLGNDVHEFNIGDDVFGLINFPGHGKAYAEYVAAPAGQLAKKPLNISHQTAAAATLAALTAYQALQKAAIQQGERVLIQGVAGGVGFPALLIAKLKGAYVIGTASQKDIPMLLESGLDEAIDYTITDFETATSNIDFVLDTLGGKNVIKAFNILSSQGRLITLPSGAGDEWKKIAEERKINASSFIVQSSGPDMQIIAGWLREEKMKPNIAQVFRFEDIPFIHQLMLDKKISGKIVVTID